MSKYLDEKGLKKLIENINVIKNNEGGGIVNETDPTVPSWVKSITQQDIKNWNNGSGTSSSSVFYVATDYGISTENTGLKNSNALQTLINNVNSAGGGIIFFPVGTYDFSPVNSSGYAYCILAKSNVSIIGENIEKTIFHQTALSSLFYYHANASTPITGCTYENFTVDAYDTGNVNQVYGKAFFYQYVKNSVWRDLILKGTVATALGIDYLDNCEINNVTCIDCGRTFTSSEPGTSGIGIGTGGYDNECFKITDCLCVGCGQYGIFIENQHTLNWGGNTDFSKGSLISNCIVRNGLNKGIGVRGGKYIIISDCNVYENAKDGIYLDNYCDNVKISNCNVYDNNNGINLATNKTSNNISINDCEIIKNAVDGIMIDNTATLNELIVCNNRIYKNSRNAVNINKSVSGLCFMSNYIKENAKGLKFTNNEFLDCVVKYNVIFDENVIGNANFSGDNTKNDLLELTKPTSIISDDITLKVDGTYQIKLTFVPTNSLKDVIYSVEGDDIIEVDDNGNVLGKSVGNTSIKITSAYDNNISTIVNVNVVANETSGFPITLDSNDYESGTIISNTGATSSSTTGGVTDFIDVSGLTLIKLLFNSFKLSSGGRVVFYDENKNFVSQTTYYNASQSTEKAQTFYEQIIENVKYIRISLNDLKYANVTISTLDLSKAHVLTASLMTLNSKIDVDGSIATQSNTAVSDYLDITNWNNIVINNNGFVNGGGIRIAQYDENNDSLSVSSFLTTYPINIEKLDNCKYIRVCVLSVNANTAGSLVVSTD